MSREQRQKSHHAKKMVLQPEFRSRRERNRKQDYSRKGRSRFNVRAGYGTEG